MHWSITNNENPSCTVAVADWTVIYIQMLLLGLAYLNVPRHSNADLANYCILFITT